MNTEDKAKMNETILMMALDSYRTRLANDPKYKECSEGALSFMAQFAIENDLLNTLPATFLDMEIFVYLEKEKRDNAK